jgi:hypothetical protein
VYTLANGIANSVVYSVLVPLSVSLNISVGDLNAGTGYLFLLAGYAFSSGNLLRSSMENGRHIYYQRWAYWV